ncbi:hypothetical protein B0A55_08472 [Friedmanniomyces simplex]|uniref:GST N-terminal domain-containing protein n=1 Tax=Friedmanniomyces simplex TaxID=329884 RepID=A0A4U0WZQ6_9PEZI|nr:hypothetical protein B0A55_08472 [Friedmanniomyces simplex]
MWTLISASPSPYARKVRIALAEKSIPFTLQTEVPWDHTTVTPQYNPLEKLPVLILDDGKTAIYESYYILEWLEAKHPEPALLPSDIDDRLFAKKVEVVCDGMCDAMVIAFFERMREPEKQSEPWKARQMRKVEGGLRQLATWVDERQGQYLIGDRLTIADLAIAAFLGWFAIRWSEHQWQTQYPALKQYWEGLEALHNFKETRPSPQTMKDQVV